ncbi:branched-chain amino acid ABC transporter permease [Cupriavidus sp. H39]|uniref:branched-chain amino acid ABC transporter permease n=1 Tax=Cupriavidus sp. H39 TaxID=3401635 RepID=UPI003CFE8D5D
MRHPLLAVAALAACLLAPGAAHASASLLLVQALNGLQFGVLLFLLAAGLTLVFGIMNFVNLAHGSLYMIGAYLAASLYHWSGSFLLAAAGVVPAMLALGLALERIALSRLAQRDHLEQVLATFGLILFFNEAARMIWGPSPFYMGVPEALSGTIDLFGIAYPRYRAAIIVAGLLVALGCYLVIHRTRLGMLIRAGAANRTMVGALGVNIGLLNALLFGLGAVLAGIAGLMAGPILSVQPGMGEPILILTMVVIVIGGIGSIRGAFCAALIVGVVDTVGRAFLPLLLRAVFERQVANAAGPALASMLIFLLMAAVLACRPQGLFPVKNGG